ncbi:hypothetical protein [Mesomycoplasma ovipneumoniae]|nr:hypothetical protein [Mesomycoplasma ovipneumoniae]WNM13200.1 hypothetical protein RNL84_02345 [Mesomycoplasma ovipneumoniae]
MKNKIKMVLFEVNKLFGKKTKYFKEISNMKFEASYLETINTLIS